jgi:hypothetical protein
VRKATSIPYVSHLFAVCGLVLEDGGTEDEAIAAFLHDGPEDQGGEVVLDEIRARFGVEVAAIVAGLSDALPSAGEPKPPWRLRKEGYLRHLGEASPSVLRVSLADKLHNARSILVDRRADGEAVWARFNAGRAQQAWYSRELLGIFDRRMPGSRNLRDLRSTGHDLFPQPCGLASDVRPPALRGLIDAHRDAALARLGPLGGRDPEDQGASRRPRECIPLSASLRVRVEGGCQLDGLEEGLGGVQRGPRAVGRGTLDHAHAGGSHPSLGDEALDPLLVRA